MLKKHLNYRRLALALIVTCLIVYLGYHALQGNRGVINLFHLTKEKKELVGEIDKLQAARNAKEGKIKMLKPDSIDVDLLDEQVKRNLGYLNKNEEAYSYDRNA